MGKCIAYTAGAITFMGIGALVTGLALYFTYPNMGRGRAGPVDFFQQTREASCELQASAGFSASGTIHFAQDSYDEDVSIKANIAGLTSGPHGFHIHSYGVMGGDCKSTGSHYNPAGEQHGGPNSTSRHVGDLGNIQSIGEGPSTVAIVDISDHQVKLSGPESVLGRAVVIHAGEDDLGESGDSAGAAGDRVACCTIFISPSTNK